MEYDQDIGPVENIEKLRRVLHTYMYVTWEKRLSRSLDLVRSFEWSMWGDYFTSRTRHMLESLNDIMEEYRDKESET